MKKIKELIITGLVVFIVISLFIGRFLAMFTLILVYFVFFYLPFIPLIAEIKDLSLAARFLLTNMAGLSYSFVYVILDVILEIPLTKITFSVITLAIVVYSWKKVFSKNIKTA